MSPILGLQTLMGLDKAVHDGHMSGFDVGRLEGRSLEVSHLLFADDTLIFCDWFGAGSVSSYDSHLVWGGFWAEDKFGQVRAGSYWYGA